MLNIPVAGQNYSIIKPKIWNENVKFYLNLKFMKKEIKANKTPPKKSPTWVGFYLKKKPGFLNPDTTCSKVNAPP